MLGGDVWYGGVGRVRDVEVDERFGSRVEDQEYRDRRGFEVGFLMGGMRKCVHSYPPAHLGLRWRGEQARKT